MLAGLTALMLLAGPAASGWNVPRAYFPPESRDTAALLLRLSDVPRGYRVGDDTGCGIGAENAPTELAQVIVTYRPESCGIVFEHRRRWRHVLSDVYVFRTLEGAAALFAARRQLLTYETGIDRLTERLETGVGEEARLLTTPDAFIEGPAGGRRPGAAVFWRRGRVLGSVLVAQRPLRHAKRLVRRLASRQDARIRSRVSPAS
jgi:hypothetical protein